MTKNDVIIFSRLPEQVKVPEKRQVSTYIWYVVQYQCKKGGKLKVDAAKV